MQTNPGVHFLHIGKTGGSAIKYALKPLVASGGLAMKLHNHEVTLRDIPLGERVVFCLRDPVARFVSGFYSRQRQGQPRIFSPWSPDEKIAFANYTTPNQLACALSSTDDVEKAKALAAMHSIQHVRSHYWEWFEDAEYLSSRSEDILFVGFQESLGEDFAQLKNLLQLPQEIVLPTDDVQSHKNPKHLDTALCPRAIENLKTWYAGDYEFITTCQRTIGQSRLGGAAKLSGLWRSPDNARGLKKWLTRLWTVAFERASAWFGPQAKSRG